MIILELIRIIDNGILNIIQFIFNCDFLDGIMAFFTHLGDAGFLWITVGIILLLFKKTRRYGLLLVISLFICALVSLVMMKPFFGRLRPFEARGITPKIPHPGGSSFPSGHTASSFGGAYSVFLYDKRWGAVTFAVASVIAFSRMYFLVHYPTDVIMGVFVGMCSTWAARYILDIILNKYNINL